jgi:DNA-binding NarL/FixJ family response regulator
MNTAHPNLSDVDDPPNTVCEGPDSDVEDLAAELRAMGWTIHVGFDVAGGVPRGSRVVCVGDVNDVDDAAAAVLAVVRGARVVVRARASREVIDALCDDLRRLGPLEHHLGARPEAVLDDEQRRILASLLDGRTLTQAAKDLHLSRRTADRRLATAREALDVSTTAEAVVEARRLGLI